MTILAKLDVDWSNANTTIEITLIITKIVDNIIFYSLSFWIFSLFLIPFLGFYFEHINPKTDILNFLKTDDI